MTSHSGTDKLTAVHTSNLEAFILRARRVAAHSLAQDFERLPRIAREMNIKINAETGVVCLIKDFPPEEQLESAAARVRPVLLQEDPVHWAKALTAIGYLTKGNEEHREYIKETCKSLRSDWKKVDSKNEPNALVYMVGNLDSETMETATDTQLSTSWFYGDFVHAKTEEREKSAAFSIQDRFESAARTTALAMMWTIATLNLVKELRGKGLLETISDNVFHEEVTAVGTYVEQEVEAVYSAPVGTPVPEGQNFSPEWEQFLPNGIVITDQNTESSPENEDQGGAP